MNTGYISSDDWEKFEREHPAAYMQLLTASLNNELQHLGMKQELNSWEKERLRELLAWAVAVKRE